MKPILVSIGLFFFASVANAQMDLPASGNNPRAKITEEVGITDITITYSRPDVNGREGKIWGAVVGYGFSSTNLVTNRNTNPWRAGANDNTTISFEHDVKIQGHPLKAGTYGLHMAVWPDSATIIFSTQSGAWGSFYYDEKYDALRVHVKPVVLDKSVEWLKYEFIEHREKHCVIALQWEKISIPFKVEVDVDNIVLEKLREQVNSQRGFNNLNMNAAAQYLLTRNMNLEEALSWSLRAAGLKTFTTLRTLATAYEKLNRLKSADSVMTEALTHATANQYTTYARALITQKRLDKALEVMQSSKAKFGDVFAVYNGLMYVYSAKSDFTNAIAAAEKAKTLAPNEAGKKTLSDHIAKLKEGKDVN